MLGRFRGRSESDASTVLETDSLVASTSADASSPAPASVVAKPVAQGPPLPPTKPLAKMPSDPTVGLDPAGVVITWAHPAEELQPLPAKVEVQFYKGFGIGGRAGTEIVSPADEHNCWRLPASPGVIGRRSGGNEDGGGGSGERWAMRLPPLEPGKKYTVRLRCQIVGRKGWSEWSDKGVVDTSISTTSTSLLSPGGRHASDPATADANGAGAVGDSKEESSSGSGWRGGLGKISLFRGSTSKEPPPNDAAAAAAATEEQAERALAGELAPTTTAGSGART